HDLRLQHDRAAGGRGPVRLRHRPAAWLRGDDGDRHPDLGVHCGHRLARGRHAALWRQAQTQVARDLIAGTGRHMALFPLKIIPAETHIGFMRWRWITVGFMLVLMAAAAVQIAVNSFSFGLDFTGGTSVELVFEQPADVDAVRERLEAAGYPGAQ